MTRGTEAPGGNGEGSAGLAAQLGRYAGLGVTIGLSTAAFAWLGAWLDERLGTDPLLVILGAFLGFAGGFYSMYRRLVLRPGDPGDGPADGEA